MKSFESDELKPSAKGFFAAAANVIKWIFAGAVIGVLCGILGTAFDLAVKYATDLRGAYNWIVFLAPVGGLAITGLYSLLKVKGQDTNTIINAVHSGGHVSAKLFPAIFVSTAITHLVGGSAGREGAAFQMGGTLGSFVGGWFRLKGNAMSIAILAGMAGYFSALFGTPVTAALFVITIIQIGVSIFDALIPCLVSSFVSYGIARLAGVEFTHFTEASVDFDAILLLKVAALAIGATVVAVIFYKTIHWAGDFFAKILPNLWLRSAIGGCAIVAFTLIYGSQRYNGTGMDIIGLAVSGEQVNWWDWILKIVLTTLTLAMGFKGGEIVPCFFIGATFGSFMGTVLGIDPAFAAAIGLVCVFCAATNSILASIVLAVELFGGGGIAYFGLACALGFILSGRTSLYSTQKVKAFRSTFVQEEE